MFCPMCASQVLGTWEFCPACGAQLTLDQPGRAAAPRSIWRPRLVVLLAIFLGAAAFFVSSVMTERRSESNANKQQATKRDEKEAKDKGDSRPAGRDQLPGASANTKGPDASEPVFSGIFVHAMDLLQNPYQHVNEIVVLNAGDWPVLLNRQAISYAPPVNPMAGFAGMRFNRMIAVDVALWDVMGQEMSRGSDIMPVGQLAVSFKDSAASRLDVLQQWRVEPLGVIHGTNAYGAPVTVPSIRFWGYWEQKSKAIAPQQLMPQRETATPLLPYGFKKLELEVQEGHASPSGNTRIALLMVNLGKKPIIEYEIEISLENLAGHVLAQKRFSVSTPLMPGRTDRLMWSLTTDHSDTLVHEVSVTPWEKLQAEGYVSQIRFADGTSLNDGYSVKPISMDPSDPK